ncbi:hypothetical protein CVT25_006452 [Psilocybe cyanescens]|uniref:Uncharacterized protein n=1 Tax=Psilocybe cyanescens TaxID=93625 RepID=A0A409XE94_PSICY|nr:hypothetical protein CVT25_006452 [Psilocybe cyanescens]
MSKERDWPASLENSVKAALPRYTGTTVDVNFNNIAKLPRYATFGKLSEASKEATSTGQANTVEGGLKSNISGASSGDAFIPSRRVRSVPGGPHTDIFDHGDEGDALSQAPPRVPDAQPISVSKTAPQAVQEAADEHVGLDFTSDIKPSRRVRENPGGNSSLSNFWDVEETAEFKPTRRVREGPGGRDSISEVSYVPQGY